ncbi:MAG: phosphohistidine phosphatase SixA [Planctomycetaceae bacterium]|nr:phosphohistidine phosphatase SixA [Planctomycetaceae bacterium]
MKELYILRHGIAVPHGTPGVAEDDRPLTAKGEQRIKQIGRCLAAMGLEPERIITSPLPRARRTAQIVAQELHRTERMEITSALTAGENAQSIADWLSVRSESRLMIVGHNPALSDLVSLLLTGEVGRLTCDLKKGGIAAFFDSPNAGTGYCLGWIATPGLMRRLGRKS